MPFTRLYDLFYSKDIRTSMVEGYKAGKKLLKAAVCPIQQAKAAKRHSTTKCHEEQKIEKGNPDQEAPISAYLKKKAFQLPVRLMRF